MAAEFDGRRVPVTDVATPIVVTESDTARGHSYVLKNPPLSDITVDLGGADVASGAGFELEPGETLAVSANPGERLHAIAPAGQNVQLQVLVGGI